MKTIPPFFNPDIEQRVEELLRQMNLKEKISLLSGKTTWHTNPVERLGIPSLVMTDGPHGVRTEPSHGRIHSPATSFPTGVAMAASWNLALIERVGAALGEETLALGCDILLGPCVNIVRHPLAGRNFESYSEDPYLAGRIGIAWVNGLQSQGVGASLKHYACNNQETERNRGSSEIDERTLREIYLAQFEAIVKEANPWTVMCSYNRINGVYASQNNYLLNEILKEEWGYEGAVVSDWGANHTIFESVAGGLDIEMPGGPKYYGQLLGEAIFNWQIDEEKVDEAARRVLRMVVKSGRLDGPQKQGALNTDAHKALARALAEDSITLLKNQGVLPLKAGQIKSLAVIGPMAVEGAIGGGGSSFLIPPYAITPLQGLQSRLGKSVQIGYEPGSDNYFELPILPTECLAPAHGDGPSRAGDGPSKSKAGEGPGLWGEYFGEQGFSGKPLIERVDPRLDFWWLNYAPLENTPRPYHVRWSGKFTAPASGTHTFKFSNSGTARLYLDGNLLVENDNPPSADFWPVSQASATVKLVKGQRYDLRIEYTRPDWLDNPNLHVRFGYTPTAEEDDRLERAAALAKKSDVAVVFVGWPEGYESEGRDRPGIQLTSKQDELVRVVAKANPNTIVVLNAGSPVAMPWVDEVAAVVLAYYPGQENGNAVANVLLGDVNPSGKLTVTFPKRLEDTPAYVNFPGTKEVRYGEGVFVGYRYYDAKDVAPLFSFGHGLSYTTFGYSALKLPAEGTVGQTVKISVKVKNTGKVTGKEVVQLYVADKVSTLARPPKELKGFAKVELAPGESTTVTFTLDERAFAYYDPYKAQWVVEPGEFDILVGRSSSDIRLRGSIVLK